MTSGIVDQITLECLMNKETYNRIMTNKNLVKDKNKDKKFYRKRISNLTNELLLNNSPENLLPDVTFAFEHYVKTCIHYFKIIDESDIIQQTLQDNDTKQEEDVTSEEKEEKETDPKDAKEEILKVSENKDQFAEEQMRADKSMLRPIMNTMVHRPTLDTFIKTSTQSSNKAEDDKPNKPKRSSEILPKQKEINLTDPELKNKGISKKKNILN